MDEISPLLLGIAGFVVLTLGIAFLSVIGTIGDEIKKIRLMLEREIRQRKAAESK